MKPYFYQHFAVKTTVKHIGFVGLRPGRHRQVFDSPGWGRGGDFQAAILQRRRGESLGFQAIMPRLAQRCRPLSPSPSPPKQAFESYLIALAGEPLIQYQTCFKRACFEGEGSQTFFTCKSHRLSGRAIY
ncbi:hypothetical protein FF011L_41180 [Roseimaritima multifibrata]|uniref:Uncharacterized protein n=1 Tax=Roseimaritima multifibrata TaxID=1930274 RepID=A0A517MKC4_9BACT|nr:hypothetical protein FF011L_41180 [Roseimaritima multifibrata]